MEIRLNILLINTGLKVCSYTAHLGGKITKSQTAVLFIKIVPYLICLTG